MNANLLHKTCAETRRKAKLIWNDKRFSIKPNKITKAYHGVKAVIGLLRYIGFFRAAV